jgi:hypothetical protein
MGFWDAVTELFDAAMPVSTVEAEEPAQKDEGESKVCHCSMPQFRKETIAGKDKRSQLRCLTCLRPEMDGLEAMGNGETALGTTSGRGSRGYI